DMIDQRAQQQAAQGVQVQQLQASHAQAQVDKTRSETARNQAEGTAHMLNALSEAHAVHNDGAAAALEGQLKLANAQQAQAVTGSQVAGAEQGQVPGQTA
ncbi:MAG: hypothetical protein JO111_11770, partial [Caulobacteraceae bacterium]|nr:hypothetical protein [Caulobacteraceae bacterium]